MGKKGKRKPAPKKGAKSAPSTPKEAPKEDARAVDATLSALSATGVLASHPLARDIKIESFNLSLHGHKLITESQIEINCGKRYGLLGLNGSGKSAFLKCLGAREVPIPEFIDIYLLENEVPASDMKPRDIVTEHLTAKIARLEKEAEELALADDTLAADRLEEIYSQLDNLNPETAETRAGRILSGLGFTPEMQEKAAKDFSGGWRMRIALAKALFIEPMMLLLDEPTNHLDLEACVWLEEYLKGYGRILFLVSHSQDFLNGVCTNIIHLHNKKLNYYTGNFDSYVKTRAENEINQMKRYKWEQDQIAEIKDFVRRFGHGSKKLARQAQSREKLLAKMEAEGLTEPVVNDKLVSFDFFDCDKLPLPVMQFQEVSFKYEGTKDYIYKDIDFGVDQTTRLALVGPNGAGKSTLLKLMTGALEATDGMVRRHAKLHLGWYRQHLMEELDVDLSPLDYMMKIFPGCKDVQDMRAALGKFGLTGKHQTAPMSTLSDGLKSRVVFAQLAYDEPHILLLDEPTNHLDIETIDALADAINRWNGGMVLVSHDFRLINQVAKEIWICEKQTLSRWEGTIMEYKQTLRKHAEEYL